MRLDDLREDDKHEKLAEAQQEPEKFTFIQHFLGRSKPGEAADGKQEEDKAKEQKETLPPEKASAHPEATGRRKEADTSEAKKPEVPEEEKHLDTREKWKLGIMAGMTLLNFYTHSPLYNPEQASIPHETRSEVTISAPAELRQREACLPTPEAIERHQASERGHDRLSEAAGEAIEEFYKQIQEDKQKPWAAQERASKTSRPK